MIKDLSTAEIRELLREDVTESHGKKLRNELHFRGRESYIPKRSGSEYFAFMECNECSFEIADAQDANCAYYFEMFCEACQYVEGDSIRECLDRAMDGKCRRYQKSDDEN